MKAPAAAVCSRCREALDSSTLDGLCPRCMALDFLTPDGASEPAGAYSPDLRFGDYELHEEVARGGMGVVYRARQISLDREVAVKTMGSGLLAGDDAIARFKAEAAAAAQLRHPHIVAIHEIGSEDGLHFFSMEYVAGQSLAALVREGPLPARRAVELMEKIARAVAYAHERGVVHRDLKPSNVLLDGRGEPRVTDFGLAKRLDAGTELTLSGQVLGTPGYLAPEQALGKNRDAAAAVDVYGLGAIFYHLLTGRAPFVGEHPLAILRQIERDDPPPLRVLNPSVPVELEAVALKCLAREPARRYTTAQEVGEEMRRWLDGRPVLAKPATRLEKAARWVRRNPAPAVAAAAIFLLLASVATMSTVSARRLAFARNNEATAAARAEAGRKEMRRMLYAAGLRVAQQLYDEGALGSLVQWLEAQTPAAGEEDLRTFEWRLLRSWSRGEQHSLVDLGVSRGAGALSLCGRFATGWKGERTVLHDLRTGKEIGEWVDEARPYGNTRHLAVNAEGTRLIATSMVGVRLWNSESREVRVLTTSPAQAAAFSPDGKLVAISQYAPSAVPTERGLVFYETESWQEKGAVPGRFPGLIWKGDALLALEAGSGELQTWQSGAAEPLNRVALPDWRGVWVAPAFSADGKRVAVVRPGEAVVVHDAATGAVIAEFRGIFAPLSVSALSPDGERLALSSEEEIIRVFDVSTPTSTPVRLRGHRAQIHSLRFGSDSTLFSWSADGTLRTWSLGADEQRPLVASNSRAAALAPPVVSRAGRWIALSDHADSRSAEGPSHCVILDAETNAPRAEVAALPLTATLDGRQLIALRAGRFITWHDADTGAQTREVALPEVVKARIPRVSPEGRFVAYWTQNDRGVVLDLTRNQQALEMVYGTMDAQFSPDGKQLALSTARVGLRLIDLATMAERTPVPSPAGKLAWSQDGRRIAIQQRQSPPVLAVVDVATLQIAGTLEGQGAANSYFAFSHDGQTLVSSATDGALRFWHLPTWSRTLTIAPSGQIRSFAFAPHDAALLVGRANGFFLLPAP